MPINKINCPHCGAKNDVDARFCEQCGKPLYKREAKTGGIDNKILIALCIILVVGFGITAGILLKNNQPNSAQAVNNNASQVSESTGFPVSQAPDLASKIYARGDYGSITYGSVTLDKYQSMYILSKAIVMIDEGKSGSIPINNYNAPDDPYGYITSITLSKSEYVDIATRTYGWMDKNGAAPNYVGINSPGQPDLAPDTMLNLFSKVLDQYNTNNQLPDTISIP
ncbi:MAG: pseudomurein-binding repeat-containing protein [Methanobacteriaceae archaeon]|nr:pseudomurein-binding repeat-containing protein [Methanobacteriaceae archaeon]